ncbi:MAG TPA: sigma-70 family RNA polymerase sigma factor [Puia sp.]|nr:sigma-70 family RNA polymerase sigma factor [Puia sp.]
MNDLHEPSNLWEYHSRIYYFLLRLLRDQEHAKEATNHVFLVLFHHSAEIEDEDHLLRRLYLIAKVAFLLRLKGKRSFVDLEAEVANNAHEEASIMEDVEVAQNETLLTLQAVTQKLPPVKREAAELYFFQGFSKGAIARHLGLEEGIVKAIISETLQLVGEELAGKNRLSGIRA